MDRSGRYWQAVVERDAAYDGRFVYAVATTRVYCAPSCASRPPLRRNVRFYPTPEAASAAGYRACLKCRPDHPEASTPIDAVVHEICRYIDAHAHEPLTLAAIAKRSGYSAGHLQRRFSALVGSSPKAYHSAVRHRRLREGLTRGGPLSEAIGEAGYGSHSRVYETVGRRVGMTPAQYRDGGRDLEIRYADADTRLGRMLIGATTRGICFLQFADDADALERQLRAEFPRATLAPMDRSRAGEFAAWMRQLDAYLAGRSATLTLPLDLRGTAFQTMVWRYLQTIPSGQVRSYGEVAAAIGRPAAVRAAASACARNKVALIVPCHRVVAHDASLGGFSCGLTVKRKLLNLEGTLSLLKQGARQ